MIYLDTSVLGAIFFREPGARPIDLVTILENQRKAKLMISAWTLTEMASIGGIRMSFSEGECTDVQERTSQGRIDRLQTECELLFQKLSHGSACAGFEHSTSQAATRHGICGHLGLS